MAQLPRIELTTRLQDVYPIPDTAKFQILGALLACPESVRRATPDRTVIRATRW
jgi:hypothetical protein